ncbi:MAG: hypothetical protein J5903_02420, partial [Clostridia bacterium]|nr:hypothetical protein [Clostridia bacterium]
MIDRDFLYEQLRKYPITDLRIGLRYLNGTPANKPKEDLIKEIVGILSREDLPVRNNKGRRAIENYDNPIVNYLILQSGFVISDEWDGRTV